MNNLALEKMFEHCLKKDNNVIQFRYRQLQQDFIPIRQKEETELMADYLKLVTGGKDLPPDGDWLTLLDTDTVFLVKDKKSPSFALGHFKILDKSEKTVYLGSTNPAMPPMIPVIAARFCQQYALHEVICRTDADLVPDPENTVSLLDLTKEPKDT